MNLSAANRISFTRAGKALLIYYGIAYLFYAVAGITELIVKQFERNVSIGGEFFASLLFVFVFGFCAVRVPFELFQANGISRKTQFCSFLMTALPMAVVMGILETAADFLFGSWSSHLSGYGTLFTKRSEILQPDGRIIEAFVRPERIGATYYFESFLWHTFVFAALLALGFFIGLLVYRLRTRGRILTAAAVALLILYWQPIVNQFDQQTNEGLYNPIRKTFMDTAAKLWGYPDGEVLTAVLICLGIALVSVALSFLLLRRMTIRKQASA